MFDVLMVVTEKGELTGKSVDKLLAFAPGKYRVVIVDNACTDGVQDYLAQLYRDYQIELVRADERLGVAAGHNLGLLATTAEAVISLDDDVWVLSEDWFQPMLGVLGRYKNTAMVGPCGSLISGRIDGAWGNYGYSEGHHFADSGPIRMKLDAIPGMCIAYRRQRVMEVGLYDEGYDPFTAQDADLCFKLKEAGWDLRLAPADVYHFGGGQQSYRLIEEKAGEPVDAVAFRSMERLRRKWIGKEHILEANR